MSFKRTFNVQKMTKKSVDKLGPIIDFFTLNIYKTMPIKSALNVHPVCIKYEKLVLKIVKTV